MNAINSDYRVILRDVLEERCSRNPRYSMRAFARDLGISVSRLSHILKGRFGLSRNSAEEIAKKIGLNNQETQYFCALVESKHARAYAKKEAAKKQLEDFVDYYQALNVDNFKVISDWYHFAIMELTLVQNFRSDTLWIAKVLGISQYEAAQAIDRLLNLELLEIEKGKLKLTGQFFAGGAGTPSEAIRKFHTQFLEKAQKALVFQSVQERDFSAVILAVDSSRVDEARQDIKKFRNKFDKKFSASDRKDSVYGLGIQFFKMNEKSEEL